MALLDRGGRGLKRLRVPMVWERGMRNASASVRVLQG